jgi:hypothetical protein
VCSITLRFYVGSPSLPSPPLPNSFRIDPLELQDRRSSGLSLVAASSNVPVTNKSLLTARDLSSAAIGEPLYSPSPSLGAGLGLRFLRYVLVLLQLTPAIGSGFSPRWPC